uniref:C3H1-type domain-containing protein n=1 Tax=Tetradesmus obliquus TaxID=3088 RepID=A0A383VJG8_TETOB|eukprot:jgi/Sobl393_1/12433/SZX65060.1
MQAQHRAAPAAPAAATPAAAPSTTGPKAETLQLMSSKSLRIPLSLVQAHMPQLAGISPGSSTAIAVQLVMLPAGASDITADTAILAICVRVVGPPQLPSVYLPARLPACLPDCALSCLPLLPVLSGVRVLGPLRLQLCCSPQLPPELEEARASKFSSVTKKRRETAEHKREEERAKWAEKTAKTSSSTPLVCSRATGAGAAAAAAARERPLQAQQQQQQQQQQALSLLEHSHKRPATEPVDCLAQEHTDSKQDGGHSAAAGAAPEQQQPRQAGSLLVRITKRPASEAVDDAAQEHKRSKQDQANSAAAAAAAAPGQQQQLQGQQLHHISELGYEAVERLAERLQGLSPVAAGDRQPRRRLNSTAAAAAAAAAASAAAAAAWHAPAEDLHVGSSSAAAEPSRNTGLGGMRSHMTAEPDLQRQHQQQRQQVRQLSTIELRDLKERLYADLSAFDQAHNSRDSGCKYWSGIAGSCHNSSSCRYAASHIPGQPTAHYTARAAVLEAAGGAFDATGNYIRGSAGQAGAGSSRQQQQQQQYQGSPRELDQQPRSSWEQLQQLQQRLHEQQ